MKTKNIIAILAALPIMAGFVGCKSDDQPEAKPAKEILMVLGGNEIQYRANETKPAQDVNIQADCRWTVELDRGNFGNDLAVSPLQGNGNGTLIITSDQNTTPGLLREATITLVSDGGLKQKITVRQTGGDDALNISKTAFSFAATTTEAQQLIITSNTAWQIVPPSGVNWLHFSRTSSSDGDGPVEITVDDAVSDAARTAAVAVTYGSGKSVQFEVSQEGMTNIYLRVSAEADGLEFQSQGGEQSFGVESNAEWHAYIPSSATDWIRFIGGNDSTSRSHTVGIGNGEIRVACAQNSTVRDRLTAVIVVAGSKNPQQSVVLIQQRTGNAQSSVTTVGDLTSMYVSNTSAEFRFSFVADAEVGNYGLVWSATNSVPTTSDNVTIAGSGSTSKNVMAALDNLQESTTYYVRAYVEANTGEGIVYSPNVVSITTSASVHEPGESDNPDPTLAQRR